tara:strand:+ start:361 stop:609 length:249 start_codon:yes stop_codon:yes gene_type:complete
MARDYKDEYKKFQSSTKQKKERAARNGRRLKFIKKGKVSKGDGKDIHHYFKGGVLKTLVESASKNRGRAEKSRLPGSKRKKK